MSGKVAVHNLEQGLIPRMLQFTYMLSFDFPRAAEPQFHTVFCSLGAACTFGEDRALAKHLLAQGYDSVYQSNAVVRTLVPTTYVKLCKMFLRWNRSFVREELRLALILWRRPLKYRLIVLWDKITTNVRYPRQWVGLGAILFLVAQNPLRLPLLLGSIAIASLPFMLFYLRSDRSWIALHGLPYAFFSFLALPRILPYALLTLRSRSWLTR